MRLLDHLKTTGMSNREARAAMDTGKVWFGGVPTRDGGREVDPQRVEIRPQSPRIKVGRDVVILWRDAHMAVVYKPAGMLSVPAPRRPETNVLAEASHILGKALPVHRIDEGTSGLMMVARTEPAQEGIKAQLEAHTLERRYLALVQGALRSEPMRVDTVLVRNRGDGKRGSGPERDPTARRAVTYLSTVQRIGPFSLLEATLETGRTHQVRIHLLELGCPLLGDSLYSPLAVARLGPRLALHAAVLGFVHPITGEAMRFVAPLADDLEHLRRELADRGKGGPRKQQAKSKGKGSRKPKKKKRRS